MGKWDLTLSFPRVPKIKIQGNSQVSFCKILKYIKQNVKVLPKRSHLMSGHTIGFHPHTQVRTTLNVSITDSGSERVKERG